MQLTYVKSGIHAVEPRSSDFRSPTMSYRHSLLFAPPKRTLSPCRFLTPPLEPLVRALTRFMQLFAANVEILENGVWRRIWNLVGLNGICKPVGR
jgi:hypothetical protein